MPITLKIELEENGSISISGPIHDKILCYGLLESAKDAVREHVAKEATKRIIAPHPLMNIKGAG